MLAVEHQLAVLVVDRCPGRHLAGVAVRGQIDDLQLRVERVAGVDLGEEFAGGAGEGDEDVADVLREQGRAGCRECQYLQAVNDRRGVALAVGVFDVLVDQMVVGGDRLERRGVGVGQRPAGRPEDVPDLEVLERSRFDDREGSRIELVRAGGGWLGHSRYSQCRACTDRVVSPSRWRMGQRIFVP